MRCTVGLLSDSNWVDKLESTLPFTLGSVYHELIHGWSKSSWECINTKYAVFQPDCTLQPTGEFSKIQMPGACPQSLILACAGVGPAVTLSFQSWLTFVSLLRCSASCHFLAGEDETRAVLLSPFVLIKPMT